MWNIELARGSAPSTPDGEIPARSVDGFRPASMRPCQVARRKAIRSRVPRVRSELFDAAPAIGSRPTTCCAASSGAPWSRVAAPRNPNRLA